MPSSLKKKKKRGKLRELCVHQWLPQPVSEIFPFYGDEKNLERITPPWLNFRVLGKTSQKLEQGTLIDYELRLHGLPLRWQSRIVRWEPGRAFVDKQVKGPYRYWRHTHTFRPLAGGTLVEDRVRYRLPGGDFGNLLAGGLVKRDLQKIFDYRREKVKDLLKPH